MFKLQGDIMSEKYSYYINEIINDGEEERLEPKIVFCDKNEYLQVKSKFKPKPIDVDKLLEGIEDFKAKLSDYSCFDNDIHDAQMDIIKKCKDYFSEIPSNDFCVFRNKELKLFIMDIFMGGINWKMKSEKK